MLNSCLAAAARAEHCFHDHLFFLAHDGSNACVHAGVVVGVMIIVLLVVLAKMSIIFRPNRFSSTKPGDLARNPNEPRHRIIDIGAKLNKHKSSLFTEGMDAQTDSVMSTPSTSSQSDHESPSAKRTAGKRAQRVHFPALEASRRILSNGIMSTGGLTHPMSHAAGQAQELRAVDDAAPAMVQHLEMPVTSTSFPHPVFGLAQLNIQEGIICQQELSLRVDTSHNGHASKRGQDSDSDDNEVAFQDAMSRQGSFRSATSDSFKDAMSTRDPSVTSQQSLRAKETGTPKHWRIHYTNPMASHGETRRTAASVMLPPPEDTPHANGEGDGPHNEQSSSAFMNPFVPQGEPRRHSEFIWPSASSPFEAKPNA